MTVKGKTKKFSRNLKKFNKKIVFPQKRNKNVENSFLKGCFLWKTCGNVEKFSDFSLKNAVFGVENSLFGKKNTKKTQKSKNKKICRQYIHKFYNFRANLSHILRKKRLILILHKLPLYFFEKMLYNGIGFLNREALKNVKIELMDENKIKVILSCLDILSLDNDITELFGETTSHTLLTRILNEAFYRHGFMAKSGKIMVESFPTPAVGYTVIITKFEEENENDEKISAIFTFGDFAALKEGGERIEGVFCGSSALYELDEKYYLRLSPFSECDFEKTKVLLADFAKNETNEYFLEGILQEYGRLLFGKNAVNMLNKSYK